ncbi:hypothetical protein BH20VER1_BH20VER1_26570 [soil metagenome]
MRLPKTAVAALLFLSAFAAAEEAPLFTDHTPATFRELEPAQQRIDPANIDDALLAAAVFHETNTRREQHELPLLQHDPRVRAAATMQVEILQERKVVEHDNPEQPEKATMQDRIRLTGLEPQFIAENLATAFLLDYKPGEQVFTEIEGDKTIYRRELGGPAIEPHTYLSFAAMLLEQWMNSPNHRINILAPEAQYLGTACRLAQDEQNMPIFYCGQVFFAPFPPGETPLLATPSPTP